MIARLRAFVGRIAREHGSPARLFWACVLGAIVGSTPFFGLHFFIAVGLAMLFRLNRVAVYAAANISIPPLAPFLGAACVEVGARLTTGHGYGATLAQLREASSLRPWSLASSFFTAWLVGAPIVGGAIGVVIGAAVYLLAARRRADAVAPLSPDERAIVTRMLARFRDEKPSVRSFARWKTRLDPVYRSILRAVPNGARVVDLGAGLGVLAILLGERGHSVVAVEWDAGKAAAGTRAARGLPVEISTHDVRSWEIPSADAILLVDVLHYLNVDAQRELLGRAAEALNDGGVIYVRESDRGPDGSSWTRTIERLSLAIGVHRNEGKPTFRRIDDLAEDLRALGLEVERTPLAGPLHPGNVLLRGLRRGDPVPSPLVSGGPVENSLPALEVASR